MSFRLIEVVLPANCEQEIGESFAERPEVFGHWTIPMTENTILGRALVAAEHSEGLSDWLADQFGEQDGFRLVLEPIAATLPRIDDDTLAKANAAVEETTSRLSREELYQDVSESSQLSWTFVTSLVASTLIACVGLVDDEIALVIGAMIIAPLLGPNVALGLGTCLGDLRLGLRALKVLVTGVGVSAAAAFAASWFFTIDPSVEEIAGRTTVEVSDLVVALAAGVVGTLAFVTNLPAVTVGVVVAVALLPPLAVFGLLLSVGAWSDAGGAGLLLVANLVCINLSSVVTFRFHGVRPRDYAEKERAVLATRVAIGLWLALLAALIALVLFLW